MRPALRPLVALLVAGVLSTAVACGGTEIKPPTPPKDQSAARADGANDVLARLTTAIADDDTAAAASLAAPSSRDRVASTVDNARALRLTGVRFRFVAEDPTASPAPDAERGAWTASVTATWRLPEDTTAVTLPVRFTFTGSGSSTRLVSTGSGTPAQRDESTDARGALWLQGPVSVVRTAGTLVEASSESSAKGLSAQAVQAVADVRRVLPGFRGPLVVEAPRTEAALEQVLGVEAGTYRAIAAVTTSVTGTRTLGTPVHVFINPAVFDGLGPKGRQVVLSHETTHVATRATFSTSLPTWLLEGFADYVALAHAGVPFSTAARQVLARVRKDGPPTSLPTAEQLSPSATGLGATYEEAWTACRFLAEAYGERRLVTFYDTVDGGTPTTRAFGTVLGTTERSFEQRWSDDLAQRAGR